MPKRYRDIAGDGGSNVAAQVSAQAERLKARMAGVRHTVAVMSGKGGVGKSAVTTNLAAYFAMEGWRVGVVDADINGPSIAKMLGVRGRSLNMDAGGMYPVLGPLDIRVISMDLFLKEDHIPVVWDGPQAESFVWRGTMEMHTLREFLTDVHWGELDLLLLDLPPGSDRLTTLKDLLPDLRGSVVVTIPSAVSQLIVAKSVTMARDLLRTSVIGLVENMTSYVCPTCGTSHPLFAPAPQSGILAGVPLLGRVPFDPRMAQAADRGIPFILEDAASPTAEALARVGKGVLNFVNSGSTDS